MNVTNFVAQKAAKKMCKWKFIYPECYFFVEFVITNGGQL